MLAGEFPAGNQYAEYTEHHCNIGGETGICLAILSEYGISCKSDGYHLGTYTAPLIKEYFKNRCVDLSAMEIRNDFGDPLLEVGFRTYSQNKEFMQGYGMTELTPMQERRALWYDIYLLLLMSLECEYRGYETLDMYEWASKLMRQQFERVLSLHKDI